MKIFFELSFLPTLGDLFQRIGKARLKEKEKLQTKKFISIIMA